MNSVHPSLTYHGLPAIMPPPHLAIELQLIPQIPVAKVDTMNDVDDQLRSINKAIDSSYTKLANATPTMTAATEARIAALDKRAADIIRRRANATLMPLESGLEAAIAAARDLLRK